jgi:hypothetical protein
MLGCLGLIDRKIDQHAKSDWKIVLFTSCLRKGQEMVGGIPVGANTARVFQGKNVTHIMEAADCRQSATGAIALTGVRGAPSLKLLINCSLMLYK